MFKGGTYSRGVLIRGFTVAEYTIQSNNLCLIELSQNVRLQDSYIKLHLTDVQSYLYKIEVRVVFI